jgi:hypothetical protein
MSGIELYLNTSDRSSPTEIGAEKRIPSFPDWNRIHLDVFEFTGTFHSVAAHPSLDTL